LGTSIGDIKNFNDDYVASDEEEGFMFGCFSPILCISEKQIDAKTVEDLHFGGFKRKEENDENGNQAPKSRQDVMKEIIAKSKVMKVTSLPLVS
jgi:hypothetical protein